MRIFFHFVRFSSLFYPTDFQLIAKKPRLHAEAYSVGGGVKHFSFKVSRESRVPPNPKLKREMGKFIYFAPARLDLQGKATKAHPPLPPRA